MIFPAAQGSSVILAAGLLSAAVREPQEMQVRQVVLPTRAHCSAEQEAMRQIRPVMKDKATLRHFFSQLYRVVPAIPEQVRIVRRAM